MHRGARAVHGSMRGAGAAHGAPGAGARLAVRAQGAVQGRLTGSNGRIGAVSVRFWRTDEYRGVPETVPAGQTD